MPASRYFYTTCLAMFLLPLATPATPPCSCAAPGAGCGSSMPILALGVVAWWYHLTLLLGVLNGGSDFEFRHPAQIYGGTAWTRQGDFSQASTLDLLRLQAASMSEGLTRTVRDMTYETTNSFGHWYMRAQMNPHPTTMNVGIVVLLALGLGYLLRPAARSARLDAAGLARHLADARHHEPRRDAAAHEHAVSRRAHHRHPFLAAFVRVVRQAGGRRAADIAAGVAAVALAIVDPHQHRLALPHANAAGDLRRLLCASCIRSCAGSDTVFLNLPRPFVSLLQFGDADRFVTSPWCLQGVDHDASWLRVGLEPQCTFADEAYSLAFTPAGDRGRARRLSACAASATCSSSSRRRRRSSTSSARSIRTPTRRNTSARATNGTSRR